MDEALPNISKSVIKSKNGQRLKCILRLLFCLVVVRNTTNSSVDSYSTNVGDGAYNNNKKVKVDAEDTYFEYQKSSGILLEDQLFSWCTRNKISNPMCKDFFETVQKNIRLGQYRIPTAIDRRLEIYIDGKSKYVDLFNPPDCISLGITDFTECERFQKVINSYSPMVSPEADSDIIENNTITDKQNMNITLRFSTCKGYANQRLSLIAGIVLGIEISQLGHLVEIVVPKLHGTYAIDSPDCMPTVKVAKDACTKFGSKVDIAAFYDVNRLTTTITSYFPNVTFTNDTITSTKSKHNPLFFNHGFTMMETHKLNNNISMRKILEEASYSGIVDLTVCPLQAISWRSKNSQYIRKLIVSSSLFPSEHINTFIDDVIRYLHMNLTTWVALHYREREHWIEHCSSVFSNAGDCFVEPYDVVNRIQMLGVRPGGAIYVTGGVSGEDRLKLIESLSYHFDIVTSLTDVFQNFDANKYHHETNGESKLTWLERQPRFIRAHMDFYVSKASTIFLGNYYSSFSYCIKESRGHLNNGIGTDHSYILKKNQISLYINGRNDGVELPWTENNLYPAFDYGHTFRIINDGRNGINKNNLGEKIDDREQSAFCLPLHNYVNGNNICISRDEMQVETLNNKTNELPARNHEAVAIVITCSIDVQFLKTTLQELAYVSSFIVVVWKTTFVDGKKDDVILINKYFDVIRTENGFQNTHIKLIKLNLSGNTANLLNNLIASYHFKQRIFSIQLLRWIGLKYLTLHVKNIESKYVWQLDSDEVLNGREALRWMQSGQYLKAQVWSFECHWYFMTTSIRSHLAGLLPGALALGSILSKNEKLFFSPFFDRQTFAKLSHRLVFFDKKGQKRRVNLGRLMAGTGSFFHHYSWTRTHEQMLQKVSSWGHALERNWKELVESEFRIFNDNPDNYKPRREFIHNSTLVKIKSPFLVCGKGDNSLYQCERA